MQEFLSTLTCTRLSQIRDAEALLDDFEQSYSDEVNVIDYVRDYGLEEDRAGGTAYYVIRDSEGRALFLFSLKCGELFAPTTSDINPLRNAKRLLRLTKSLQNLLETGVDFEELRSEIVQLMECQGITFSDLVKEIMHKHKVKKDFFDTDNLDASLDQALRVHHTQSGVQLVHFCKNLKYASDWSFQRSIGEVVFWHFIVPVIEQLRALVGCEYLFLFAADSSLDRDLRNFYEMSLGFVESPGTGVNKPFYDWYCYFMMQSLENIATKRQLFFELLNEPHDKWETVLSGFNT